VSDQPNKRSKSDLDFAQQIGAKVDRKIEARRDPAQDVSFGLGMMGLIGWSVVVPTLLGVALGIWLDKHHPGKHSWTLTLLIAGLAIGCFNAWHCVATEENAENVPPNKNEKDKDE
jgi:ATP synthase protein I